MASGWGMLQAQPRQGVGPCQVLGSSGAYLLPFYHLYLYSFALIFKEISFLFPLFLSALLPCLPHLLLSAPDLPPALALCPFPTVFLRTSSQGVHPRLGSLGAGEGVGAPSHLWVHPAREVGGGTGASLHWQDGGVSQPRPGLYIASATSAQCFRLQGVSEPRPAPFLLAAEDRGGESGTEGLRRVRQSGSQRTLAGWDLCLSSSSFAFLAFPVFSTLNTLDINRNAMGNDTFL